MLDLIIIGGGISGLSVAWKALKAGYSFRLIEAGPDLGGAISSYVRFGTLFETGPAALQVGHAAVAKLLEELDLWGFVVAAPFAPPWLHAAPEPVDQSPAMASLAGGLGQLTRALKNRIGGFGLTSTRVRSIAPPPYGWKVDIGHSVLRARRLVIATSARHCAQLLSGLDPRAADLVGDIPTVSLAVINQVYRKDQLPFDSGSMGSLQLPLAHPGVISSVALHHLPGQSGPCQHSVGVRLYVGGPGRERAFLCEERYLAEQASSELRDLLDLRGQPLASQFTKHSMGIPTFGPSHAERLCKVSQAIGNWPDLHLAGNWLHRPGIAESVDRANRLVKSFDTQFSHSALPCERPKPMASMP